MDTLTRRHDAAHASAKAPWWPAVDALRGLAVLAVLLYHHNPRRFPGGFLGVSLFFTLSGFLITTLVLRERAATGTISVVRFWSRRFRRLAPVALLGLCLALAVGAIVQPDRIAAIGGDARAAALNVANWRFASAPLGYADTLADPSPVSHYWSLAIEEQFYLGFPIVALLALRRGRRALAVALVAVASASFLRQVTLHDNNRIYLGTDTRVLELAVGGLAAIAWFARDRVRRVAGARVVLDVAAGLALAALVASWATTSISDTRLWRGGMAVHAGLAATVVVGAVSGRWFPALGRLKPLVALGRVSYGVYVVHLPMFLLLSGARVGFSGVRLLVLRGVATVAVAALIHVVVEQPVRIGGALPRWQAPLGFATGLAVVVLLSAAVPNTSIGSSATAVAGASTDLPTVVTVQPPAGPAPDDAGLVAAPDPTAIPVDASADGAAGPSPLAGAGAPGTTLPPPPSPPRLLVVGDSTGRSNGEGIQAWAARTGAASVDLVWHYGCTFLLAGELEVRDGWVQTAAPACVNLIATAVSTARTQGSEAIVVFINSMQLGNWRLPGDLQWRAFGDPVFEAAFRTAAQSALGQLSTVGVPVLLADVPVPEWVCELSGPLPGSGEPTVNDAARAARYNEIMAEEVVRFPLVRIVPFAAALAQPDGTISTADRPDGLHVTTEAIVRIMGAGFAAQLQAAREDVGRVEAGPAALDP